MITANMGTGLTSVHSGRPLLANLGRVVRETLRHLRGRTSDCGIEAGPEARRQKPPIGEQQW
jgi:hypothetical protein